LIKTGKLCLFLLLCLLGSCFVGLVSAQQDTQQLNLFFRSDYGLSEQSSGSLASFTQSGASSASFGFRVWLINMDGSSVELTNGVPVAVNSFTSTQNTARYVSGSWLCPDTPLILGEQSLRVVMYSTVGANTVARAEFKSGVLMSDMLVSSQWVFTYRLDYTANTFTVSWGGKFGGSGISNIVLGVPSDFEVMFFKLLNLDLFGFIMYPYFLIFKELIYVILAVAIIGAYYIWHGKVSVVLFLLIVFGGILFPFLPFAANLLVWALMAVALAILLFRLFR